MKQRLSGMLLALAAAPAVSSPAHPLAGHWRCHAPPVAIPALLQIPAGRLQQATLYQADAQGRWHSSSTLRFTVQAAAGQRAASYQLQTRAGGLSRVHGTHLHEQIHTFAITPGRHSTGLSATARQQLHAWLLRVQHDHRQRHYLLQNVQATRYTLVPRSTGQTRSSTHIQCQRLAEPKR